MDRREFVRSGSALGLAGAVAPLPLLGREPSPRPPVMPAGVPADLVLRGAVVFDGTGAAGREADVALAAGRIAEVGTVSRGGAEELDLRGLALAPGFIDIHSHADLSLLVEPRAESRIRQGVTLEVVGQDGGSIGPWTEDDYQRTRETYLERYGVPIDFKDLGGFLARLERTPAAVHVISMVGHNTLRATVVGDDDRPATEEEIVRMRALLREALAQGAVGFSSGLEYTPGAFAPTDELVALASELRGTGYPYASHMRNEDDRLLAAVEEALHVGRLAGVPVQISHLKAQGLRNHWKAPAALDLVERARADGLDVHFDRYPYVAYSTGLSNLFPAWARAGGNAAFAGRLRDPSTLPAIERAVRDKVALLGSWDAVQITRTRTGENAWARGRKLGALAAERNEDPFGLAVRLLLEEEGSVGMIGFGMSEENTARILAHPLGMLCSDGGAFAPYGPLSEGVPHPRAYGSFPRLLGRYVREQGALTLEAAVHKMTGMPAAKLGLSDRGVVRPGAVADLVAFDPDRVEDRGTFEEPHQYPVGIVHVLVAGSLAVRDEEHTGVLAGRPIRGRAGGAASHLPAP